MPFKKILVVGEVGLDGLRPESLEAVTAALDLRPPVARSWLVRLSAQMPKRLLNRLAATGLSTVYLVE